MRQEQINIRIAKDEDGKWYCQINDMIDMGAIPSKDFIKFMDALNKIVDSLNNE